MQTAAASLVAAIPAGILATLVVMMFLTNMENLKGLLPIFLGAALVLAAVVALMPFGILLFSGKTAAKAAAKPADKAAAKAGDDEEPEMTSSEDLIAGDEEFGGETVEFDPGSSGDVAAFDDEEAFEETDDDFIEEDEEKPKKKGKKK